MAYEKEILKSLRDSLDKEDDEISILSVLESHHKYLKAYVGILDSSDSTIEEKQASARLLLTIFEMHARAEENTLYGMLKASKNHEVRLQGLKNFDEHLVAHEVITQLHDMGYADNWSEMVETKMNVLTRLISSHLHVEEKVMFPMTEKYISEEQLMDLAVLYLDHCKSYLDKKMPDFSSDVSRSDVMTFFY